MVEVLPMVDMALDPAEVQESIFPSVADTPRYPYGLCISFCDKELEKLGIDYNDLCIGDMIHMHCMAIITSKSQNETQSGDLHERVECQITHVSAENEHDEDEEAEEELEPLMPKRIAKLYK